MDYTLIRSRRKTIAILVARDGSVTVRAPLKASARQIAEFIHSKEAWIRSKQDVAHRLPVVPSKTFQTGELFLFLGKSYPLAIKTDLQVPLSLNSRFELALAFQSKALAVFTRWYRQQALHIFMERAAFFGSWTGLNYKLIKVSSARTRWGSCSSSGTLSFTWRLVMAPPVVIDYVVVHELVHTRVRNHSHAFWSQVEKILPDYQNEVAWLKTNGELLTLE